MKKVGTKGQVVIDKRLRDKLGIGPGWMVFQTVVDGQLVMRFFPPEHNRSLKGILASKTNRSIPPEEWHDAKEWGVAKAVAEDWAASEFD